MTHTKLTYRLTVIKADVTNDQHMSQFRQLLWQYAQSLDFRYSFDQFGLETFDPEHVYGRADEAVFLVMHEDQAVGCVAIQNAGDDAELRRLYVRPDYRTHGVGHVLLKTVMRFSQSVGYRGIVLQTRPSMDAAIGLYQRFGFQFVSDVSEFLPDAPVKMGLVF